MLGFVDPGKVDGEVFYFISAGHRRKSPMSIKYEVLKRLVKLLNIKKASNKPVEESYE